MSTSWMESDRPDIHSVIPMTPDAVNAFTKLYKDSPNGLDVAALQAVLEMDGIKYFGQLTPPDNPMITKDEETGVETAYQVWIAPPSMGHRPAGYEHIPSPDYAIVLISQKEADARGESVFKPQMLLRGKDADAMIVGGMTCCGKVGLQTHWTQTLPDGRQIDAGRVPLEGLMHDEHALWLKGKVHEAPQEVLLHILQHVMAHCFPNSPKYAHACSSEADIGGYISMHAKPSP